MQDRNPKIERSEYESRRAALVAKLAEWNLEALLVSARDSIYYLTGLVYDPLERPLFILFRRHDPPPVLVPMLERDHLGEAAGLGEVNVYREYPAPGGESWQDRLRALLGDATTIGVEPTLSQEIAGQLTDRLLRTMPLVEELRIVKSPAEIEMIRRACRYADLGVDRLLAASYYGSMVAEGFAETRGVTKRIIREVDDWEPLSTKVLMATWAAPRSGQPHSVPKLDDRLKDGPHVALVLTTVNGYSAECERTYFTKKPTDRQRQRFGVMMRARQMAFDMAVPGRSCSELDAEVRQFLTKEGYADALLHRTGHGIGIAYHAEAPWLAEGSSDVLAPGMVMSIEPGIYFPDAGGDGGGYRHSDTVLVTDNGPEWLTKSPTDLDLLTITDWKPIARAKGALIRRALRLG